MSRRAGAALMALGLLLLGAAGGLSVRNRAEDAAAGASSARALAMIDAAIEPAAVREENSCAGGDPGMPRVQIDGMNYIGRLRIPTLELELPILSQWDEDRLKIAPCRYSGTARGGDLVLLAHNYRKHFGPIRHLEPGDELSFEDMEGTVFVYEVTGSIVVEPTALETVTSGAHDLTLITCTYGGRTRLVVFCDRL